MTHARAQIGEEGVESTQALLEQTLRAIAGAPDAVRVKAAMGGDTTVFCVQVASADMASLVGSSRRTIQALRMIVAAVGLRHKRRFVLEIEELAA